MTVTVGDTVRVRGTRRKSGRGNAIGVVTSISGYHAVVEAEVDGTAGVSSLHVSTGDLVLVTKR